MVQRRAVQDQHHQPVSQFLRWMINQKFQTFTSSTNIHLTRIILMEDLAPVQEKIRIHHLCRLQWAAQLSGIQESHETRLQRLIAGTRGSIRSNRLPRRREEPVLLATIVLNNTSHHSTHLKTYGMMNTSITDTSHTSSPTYLITSQATCHTDFIVKIVIIISILTTLSNPISIPSTITLQLSMVPHVHIGT